MTRTCAGSLADRLVGVTTRSVAPDALAVRPVLVPVVAALADTPPSGACSPAPSPSATVHFATARPASPSSCPWARAWSSTRSTASPRGWRRRSRPACACRCCASIRASSSWPARARSTTSRAGAGRCCSPRCWRPRAPRCWPAAREPRLVQLGLIVSGAGLLVAGAVAGLGEFVVAHAAHAADLSDARERGAVRAVWSALFSDLLTAGLLAALCGAVVAGLAAQALPRIDVTAGRRWARGAATSPAPAARLARAGGLIALGALLVLEPALAGRLVLIAAGLAVVALGISQLPSREAPEPAGERIGHRRAAGPGRRPGGAARDRAGRGAARAAGSRARDVRRRGAGEQLQRLRGGVRAASRPGGLPRHPQLVCRGRGTGLVLRQPALRHRAPAARRDPRLPDRRALRRARPAQRGRADLPEGGGLIAQQGGARAESRGAAHRGPARGPQPGGPAGGRAARLPVPYALRAGRRAVRRAARAVRALPRRQPARGGDPVRGAVCARGRDRARPGGDGSARAGGGARERRAAAHAAGADPRRHAPRGAGRAGRRRAALVPARLRPRPGHAARRHHAGRAALRALPRRARQPAVPRQPLDPALPALGVRQRAHRRRLPRAPARALRAPRARLLPNLVAVDFYEQSGVVDAAKGLNQ